MLSLLLHFLNSNSINKSVNCRGMFQIWKLFSQAQSRYIVRCIRRFVDLRCVMHGLKGLNRCRNCGGDNWQGLTGVWCWHSSMHSHEGMCCMYQCPWRECNHSVYADHCQFARWIGSFEAPHRAMSDEQLARGRYICCVLHRIVPMRLARSMLLA